MTENDRIREYIFMHVTINEDYYRLWLSCAATLIVKNCNIHVFDPQ